MSTNSSYDNKLTEYMQQHPEVVAVLLSNDARRGQKGFPSFVQRRNGQGVASNRTGDEAHKLINTIADTISKRRKAAKRLGYALTSIAAAVIVFFALTPTGRALADQACHLLLKFADGVLYILPADQNVASEKEPGSSIAVFHAVEPADFTDIQQASAYIQSPLLYVDAADVTIESIHVDSNDAVNDIFTTYRIDGKLTFHVQQTILKKGSRWGATIDINDSQPVHKTLFNGEEMLCAYTDEGFAIGFSHWENVELFIDSATLKWERLAEYADHLTYTNPNR